MGHINILKTSVAHAKQGLQYKYLTSGTYSLMCMFCRSLFFLAYFFRLAIVSVLLRYTDSDYPFWYLQAPIIIMVVAYLRKREDIHSYSLHLLCEHILSTCFQLQIHHVARQIASIITVHLCRFLSVVNIE